MTTFFLETRSELDRNYSLKVIDDGRVAYAYLVVFDDIVSDVWLYNRNEAPAITNWSTDIIPYLNPVEYLVKEALIGPITDAAEVRCEWTESSDGIIEVEILIRGKFIAGMAAGSTPGWSALVVKDGPLALVY